jgi:orotidine-5'-phosphate decarboxylase
VYKSRMQHFADDLVTAIRALGTPCIVGLDPTLERMPAGFLHEQGIARGCSAADCASALAAYCELALEAVADLVPAVKPQMAYFERWGAAGVAAAERVIASARRRNLLVIIDGKRGDIGSTSEAYASAYLRRSSVGLSGDALTLNPYLGPDSMEPFFRACAASGTGAFVCAKTSNSGSAWLQELVVDGRAVFERVAEMVAPWVEATIGRNGYSGIGAVTGATFAQAVRAVRTCLPRSFLLLPGMGAQGGTVEAVRQAFNDDGLGAVVSVSRSVLFPPDPALPWGPADMRAAALAFIAQVRQALA